MPLIKSASKKAMGKNVATEMDSGKPQDQAIAIAYNIQKHAKKKMSFGGMAEGPSEPKPSSVAEAIMRKRKAQHMADGGMVDEQESNDFDELGEEADLKELYDEDDQPLDSDEQEDAQDMISKIRAKLRQSRGL